MPEEDFALLLESAAEMTHILQGKRQPSRVIRVKAPKAIPARAALSITRPDLAAMLGVSPRTIENWEQGRRSIPRMARIILNIAARHPKVLREASQSVQHRAKP